MSGYLHLVKQSVSFNYTLYYFGEKHLTIVYYMILNQSKLNQLRLKNSFYAISQYLKLSSNKIILLKIIYLLYIIM